MDQHNQKCFTAATKLEEVELQRRRYPTEGKRCDVYVEICEQSKLEAAKQRSHLLEAAETLCSENSEKSQRKGKVFKKLAEHVEKSVFDGLQRDICDNLWLEAAGQVYGNSNTYLAKS